MESTSLVSWQYENFSSAELVSPPVSPASPSLYNNGAPLSPNNYTTEKINSQCSEPTTRAQMASNILNDLELYGSVKNNTNDFGENWNEESINLGLFEELAEIEYTPPASPKKIVSNPVQHQLNEYSFSLTDYPSAGKQISETPADLSALTAEFQAILESLPKENTNTDSLSQVLQIVGIPTTMMDGEAMVPIEFDLSGITNTDMQSIDIEIDDVNVNIINEDDIEIMDESEIYDLESSVSSVCSIEGGYVTGEDDIDHHSNAAEKILDALLLGDVSTAESFLPNIMEHGYDDDDDDESNDSVAIIEDVTSSQPSTPLVDNIKKPERRGRKPGKKLAKGSLAYIKDKSLRKKEQNKTAATRYRQKKKVEVSLVLNSESQLQKEHDELQKSKDDLSRQILMVKQLLREVIQARKPPTKGKTVVPGGRITVSSVIQARNRRK